MSEEMARYETQNVPVLTDDIIKRYICPEATDKERYFFLMLCKSQGLNPFLREVYLIKYGTSPASIVTGKETFLKRAAKIADYRGFKAGIIVVNGDMSYREGSMYIKGKETLVGGWADVYREGLDVPIRAEVSFDEYVQKKNDGSFNKMWTEKPATMIRKVALVQALRETFPDEFGGLYSPEEMPIHTDKLPEYDLSAPIQSPPPRRQAPQSTGEDVRVKLATELSEYCTLEDGVVNMDLYTATLKEVSQFGNPPKWITDIDKASEAWCGKALGALRKKVAETKAAEVA